MKKCDYCGTEFETEERCPLCGSSSYKTEQDESVDSRQRKIDEKILKQGKKSRVGFVILAGVLVLLALFAFYVFQNYSIPVLLKDGAAAAQTAKKQEKADAAQNTASIQETLELMDSGDSEKAPADEYANFVELEQPTADAAAEQIVRPTSAPTATAIPTSIPTATLIPTSTAEPAVAGNLRVGNEFYLGTFEQDNNLSNGKEPIVWQVLAVENGRVLVLSKYGLDMRLFNDTMTPVTWESCSLRKWLNGEFYQNAFSDAEKAVIMETTISNPSSPKYGTDGGNATTDKVFLLSEEEAKETYFSDMASRVCYPTQYAIAKNAFISSIGGTWWWTRSPAMSRMHFTFVGGSGAIEPEGFEVTEDRGVARPAMWLRTR